MRNKKVRSLVATVTVLALCVLLATTALAGEAGDRVWRQSVEKVTIDMGYLTPDPDINRGDIRLHFVATSPADGKFKVVLQKQGLLGIWFNVDYPEITASQCSGRKYDTWFNDYVNGQPNTIYWITNQAGNYRVILEDPTAPQMTQLSRIVWKAV